MQTYGEAREALMGLHFREDPKGELWCYPNHA
jgi:hypothetical protein